MTINATTTGDPPLSGYYDTFGNWVSLYPTWNPPVYIQPTYVPYPVYYTPGTIIFNNDWELKEEIKELKEEVKKLRKELKKTKI